MSHNVNHSYSGDILTITVDMSRQAIDTAPFSQSGKTRLIGSTAGTVKLGSGLTFALNVMAKAD